MEKWTGSKLRKEYIKAVYFHPAYFSFMQSTSCEMLDWMKFKLESRLPGEISITSDTLMTPPLYEEELKSLVMKVKEKQTRDLSVIFEIVAKNCILDSFFLD